MNSGFSNGVSLQGFAEYLISLGADQAVNLDGGGSTTMLVKSQATDFLL
ncbi:phosphodiester glycosidase family protein [Anaerobacillus sp. HL2]|nr:phosphodiester glycosidase family protein [Anaerobacillus sp. HL2]